MACPAGPRHPHRRHQVVARQRNRRDDSVEITIPAIYQRLSDSTYRGRDPRIFVSPDGQYETVQAALAVHSPLLDAFDANEPVIVPRHRVSNHVLRQQYPWLSGVGTVIVHPDDTVEPTDLPADGM